jgi:hypothetical protein
MSNKLKITPIVQGMKGSVVTQVLNANFQNLLNRIDELEAENENLKKTAMIGNNGNGGITEDAVVNVIFNPQTIMAKTTEKDVHYTVDVQVMCGNQELSVGDDNPQMRTFAVDWDRKIDKGGIICYVEKKDGQKLSFDVNVTANSIADGSFRFHITYRGVTYSYEVAVLIVNKDLGVEFAQGIFVSTIFKRSDTKPDTPVGGAYSIPLPTTYGEPEHQGWHDGIPSGTGQLWTSHRKFTSNGKAPQETEWSDPILAMDSADLDVCFTSGTTNGDTPAAPLQHGDQDSYVDPCGWHNIGNEFDVWMATSVKSGNEWGPWSVVKIKGEDGSSSDWKNTIYKRSTNQPARPTSDTLDFIDNNDITDENNPNYGWHDVPDDNGTWWMSCGYVDGDTSHVQEIDEDHNYWTYPIKVAGGSGQGVFVSTVFKRSETQPQAPRANDGGFNEPIPESTGWSDGIPADNGLGLPVWESHRKFTSDGMNQDDHWSTPRLMMDTANFDCCFTAYAGVPREPQHHGDQSAYADEYGWHNDGNSDDIWMATSYKAANSSEWGAWVITRIKGESGKNGDFTNYIFKSSTASTVDAPTINNPNSFVDKARGEVVGNDGRTNNEERNQDWKDGPGIGDTWWMSCAVIDGSTGLVATDEGWSKPTKLTGERGEDGSYTEYKYAINSNEVDPPVDIPIEDWDDTVSGALHTLSVQHRADGTLAQNAPDYRHVPSLHYMWMGMRRHYVPEGGSELIAGNWEYARVTGEKGEDGTKLKVAGTKESYRDLFLLSVNASNVPLSKLPADGDSWIVNEEMWVWSESADWKHADSTTLGLYNCNLDPARWQNCGRIVGPPGESQYLHIKYAKALDGEIKDDNGDVIKRYPMGTVYNTPEGCDYMGTLVDNNVEAQDIDYTQYTWSRFTGADGYGYEYIYKLSTSSIPYSVPTSAQCKDYWYKENNDGTITNSYTTNAPDSSYRKKTYQDNDYVPSGWTDNPLGITEAYPFEYMCKRVRQNNVWQEFTGQATDNTKAIMYSYKGKDGQYEEHQWNIFDSVVFTAAMENDPDWSTDIPASDTYKGQILWERRRTVTPKTGDEADEYGKWSYIRVSGEKGDTGTGIKLNGSFDTLEQLFLTAYRNGVFSNANYDETLLQSGDAYTVSGDIWTWNVSNDDIQQANKNADGETVDYGTNVPCHHWRNGGKVQGDVQYLHIKYAHTASAVTIDGHTEYYVLDNDWLSTWAEEADGEKPSRYIGICYNNTETDPDITDKKPGTNEYLYKWRPYRGEDGIDYEMIYTRTSGDTEPHAPKITVNANYSGGTKMWAANPLSGFTEDGKWVAKEMRDFQKADFIPIKETRMTGNQIVTEYDWTDNPMGPTEELPYEWACRRDKVKGMWTDFYGKASDMEYAFLFNKFGASPLEINIPYGQYLYYTDRGDGKAKSETKVIEFVLSKDGLIVVPDTITISGVTVTTPDSAGNDSVVSAMSNFFTSYTYNGPNNKCNNPHITLVNKNFLLDKTKTYKIECGIKVGKEVYTKIFFFSMQPADGANGESIRQYKIVPDKTALKFDAAGRLDMADDDGISIFCYVCSGDTQTQIDWRTENNDYAIRYKVDSAQETAVEMDQRAGKTMNAFIKKSALNLVVNQVTINLYKVLGPNQEQLCQAETIPVAYDMGSRDNLFSKENPITVSSNAMNDYLQLFHTDDGFIMTVRNIGICTIKIGDNPYESQFVKGGKYLMTAQIGVEFISGVTKAPNAIFQFAPEVSSTATSWSRSPLSDLSLKSASIEDKHTIKWWTEDFGAELPRLWFNMKTRQHLLIRVSNLKIEKINGNNFTPTAFNGLGKLHSVAQPNLLNGSGVLGKAFTSFEPTGCTVSTIPYGYCNNTVKTIKANDVTRYNQYNKFFTYQTRVQTDTTYTLSWYQKGATTNEQKFFVSIANKDNAVPSDWLIYCGGEGPKLWHKTIDSNGNPQNAVYNSHPLTMEWTRHYMTFRYASSTGETCSLDIDFVYQFNNSESLVGDMAYFAMPKLEESDYPTPWQASDQDRSTKPLRGPMAWVSGATYQGGGIDDEYQDFVTLPNANAMYLCKYTHTADSSNHPANGTANSGWSISKPWLVTEKKDFIAADVIWSDTFKSHMMDAVNGRIGDLEVRKLHTMMYGGPTIEISNGTMQVFGSSGKKNIEIGVDDYGQAVLKFYNNNGDYLYDLGPEKITQDTGRSAARFNPVSRQLKNRKPIDGTLQDPFDAPFRIELEVNTIEEYNIYGNKTVGWELCPVTLYQYFDGSINVGNVEKYTTHLTVAPTGDADYTLFAHTPYHEKYFISGLTNTATYLTTETAEANAKLVAPGNRSDNVYESYIEYDWAPYYAAQSAGMKASDHSNGAWSNNSKLWIYKNGVRMNKTPYYFCMNPFPSSTDGDADSGMYYIWLKDSQNKWYRICRVGLNGGYESYDRELPVMYRNLTFKEYAQLHNS